MNDAVEGLVMTRGAMFKSNTDKDFIAISYTARKKKQNTNKFDPNAVERTGIGSGANRLSNNEEEIGLRGDRKEQEIQMKRARYDVIKFGSSGFVGTKKEEAKIALAVKLGAKPPKNKVKNYKELQLERQKAKESAKKQEMMSEIGKNMKKRRIDKRRRKQPNLLSTYGVVKNVSKFNKNNKERQ